MSSAGTHGGNTAGPTTSGAHWLVMNMGGRKEGQQEEGGGPAATNGAMGATTAAGSRAGSGGGGGTPMGQAQVSGTSTEGNEAEGKGGRRSQKS